MHHVTTRRWRIAVVKCGSSSRRTSSSSSTQELLLELSSDKPSAEEGEEEGHILAKVLHRLSEPEKQGCALSDRHYISLLKACHVRKTLTHVKQIYEHLSHYRSHGIEGILGDYLVITMVKCGSLEDALDVFHSLSQHSVYAWTAIISGFTESGQAEEALKLQEQMKEEGVEPNQYTFVSLLKACGCIYWFGEGHALHTEIEKKGWACDIFIGSSLVSMYGKCGRLEEAEDVFMKLVQRNIVTWNGLLASYVQQEQGEKALRLYRQMIEEVVCPNETTIVIALQACRSIADEEEPVNINTNMIKLVAFSISQALHGAAFKKGLTHNIGCTLVSVYGKCLSVEEAEHVFCTLSPHNVIAWNSMISAYAENGQGKSALQLFCHMQHMGVSPDEWTFVSALHACGIIAEDEDSIGDRNKPMSFDIGHSLHKDVERMGFESHAFVGNSLLTMYNKIGTIANAESIFAGLCCPNLVSWNAMLSAYVGQGQEEMALRLYRQMHEENKGPNEQTFTIVMHACGRLAVKNGVFANDTQLVALKVGQAVHFDALREGFASHAFVGNTLISMYSKCGRLADSECAFQSLFAPNIVSWNAMLSAYVENGYEEKALLLFRHMLERGVNASKLTFRTILQACCSLAGDKSDSLSQQRQSSVSKVEALKIVQAFHADVERMGFDKDSSIAIFFMSVYSKCEMLDNASYMFGSLCQKDVTSCNVMLSVYVEHGLHEKALHLYREMLLRFGADEVTLVCTLRACSDLGLIDESRELHFTLISSGHDLNPLVSTTLIHTYGYCATMIDAMTVLDSLLEPDVVSWGACLAGYAREGNHVASLCCFLEMKATGVEPNRVAFLSLLHSCSHTGLVGKGLQYFESMKIDFGIRPDLKCYAGVIDLLGRAGDFRKVKNMLQKLPMQDDLLIWLCLLNVCCIHGNMELGVRAFDYAVNLQPEDAASYILMSNMCAYQDMLDPVKFCGCLGEGAALQNSGDSVPVGFDIFCE